MDDKDTHLFEVAASDVAVDYVTDNVYWFDYKHNSLHVGNSDLTVSHLLIDCDHASLRSGRKFTKVEVDPINRC